MAIFDVNNLFFHTGSAYGFTSGEFATLTSVTTGAVSTSTVINLTNARDLGIGDGVVQPTIGMWIGTGITSSCSGLRLNFTFQGSTDSTTWTTYSQTGNLATASLQAQYRIMPWAVPPRLSGAALPQYYRIQIIATDITGALTTVGLTTGTIIAGIITDGPHSLTLGQYPSGFTVV